MDWEEIGRWSRQRIEEIRRHFRTASQDFNEEAIHQMRVEIKRLKAFLQLLEGLSERFEAKQCLRPVRPVYKAAGRIRDLQVQFGLARQWQEASGSRIDAFCQHLRQLEEQAQASFGAESRRFDASVLDALQESVLKALSGLKARQAHRRAEEILEGMQSELLQRSLESKPQDNLHPLRILAKRSRHTAELLQMCLISSPPCDESLQTLKSIEQALGQWHDQEVALEFVETFQQQAKSSPADHEYRQALQKKKRRMRRAFLQFLPDCKSILKQEDGVVL